MHPTGRRTFDATCYWPVAYIQLSGIVGECRDRAVLVELAAIALSSLSSTAETLMMHLLDHVGVGHFWIFGTPSRNTIPCSKNHVHCHTSFLDRPAIQGDFACGVFQKCSNSRLMGKVPKFALAAREALVGRRWALVEESVSGELAPSASQLAPCNERHSPLYELAGRSKALIFGQGTVPIRRGGWDCPPPRYAVEWKATAVVAYDLKFHHRGH